MVCARFYREQRGVLVLGECTDAGYIRIRPMVIDAALRDKAAFCRKLVAFFVAAQHDGFFGYFPPPPRKDICRTLCVLKYHKHLVDGIKRDYVDRLYSPTEESGNVEASLPMHDEFPGQYGPILYKLIAKLSILKEMAKETTENLASSTAVRENKCERLRGVHCQRDEHFTVTSSALARYTVRRNHIAKGNRWLPLHCTSTSS